jgi:TPR repeat protein
MALLGCALVSRAADAPGSFADIKSKAEWGDMEAQFKFGMMYYEGKGAPKNFVEAQKWFRRAADQGQATAQFNLGTIYYNGQGVPKNHAEALKWYRKSAEQGLAAAQNILGDVYFDGQALLQDYREAAKWYRKAAYQGYAISQAKLGVMYAEGLGMPPDPIEAHKWFNLAAAKGFPQAAQARNTLAPRMSPQQIAEAQKRAAAFRVGQPEEPEGAAAPGAQIMAKFGKIRGSGSGFFITDDGYLLTNFHVVENAGVVKVSTPQGILPAKVIKTDATNDMALLKVTGAFKSLPVMASRTARLGETVFTVGYPNIELQGFSSKLTKGEISSLTGLKDDPHWFQVSVPVQPGNSGGPLVNQHGNVVGIVAARLSDFAGLQTSGALPQNVNYAVKSDYVTRFLQPIKELRLKPANPSRDRRFEEVVKEAEDSAALILVY